jgi:hypothetical protein
VNTGSVRQHSERWPFAAAASTLLALLAVYLWTALKQNDGHFVYAQDDPYIHLSIARTLALHGVWGVTPDQFAPASSSPLWTVLLAAVRALGGEAAWWPFLINIAAALLVLWVADRLLARLAGAGSRFVALVTLVLVIPLPTLVFIGMEHTLHIACVLALCGTAAVRLAGDGRDRMWPLGIGIAALTGGLRYEGLFVIGAVAAACALRRRWFTGLSLAGGGAFVPVVYACYAVAHGAPALPNSVLMKSDPARFGSWMSALGVIGDWVGVLSLYQRPIVAVLVIAALLLAALRASPGRDPWTLPTMLSGWFVSVTVLHVCLVKVEWFFRYEAYLVALGLTAVASAASDVARSSSVWEFLAPRSLRRLSVFASAVVLALPLVNRGAEGMLLTVPATGEIYRQQYQMGVFFGRFYAGQTVALNDIGAVAWLARVRVVDLIGLASPDVAKARRRNADDTAFFDAALQQHGAAAACIYDYYFSGVRRLPASWLKVGEWAIEHQAAVSRDTVAFYAPSGEKAHRLRDALNEFSGELPRGVTHRPVPDMAGSGAPRIAPVAPSPR